MVEAKFTKSLKIAIYDRLAWRLRDSRLLVGLDNITKMPPQFGMWRGRPDIWISHDYRPQILIIEIEHRSSGQQAFENVGQAWEWCMRTRGNEGPDARAAYLHLIAEQSNVSSKHLKELILLHKRGPRQGFLYQLFPYRPVGGDERRSLDTAEAILHHPQFKDTFRMLLQHALT